MFFYLGFIGVRTCRVCTKTRYSSVNEGVLNDKNKTLEAEIKRDRMDIMRAAGRKQMTHF